MNKTKSSKFYVYPGVKVVTGCKNNAYLNLAKGEIYSIGRDEIEKDKEFTGIYKDMENIELGIIVATDDTIFEAPVPEIEFPVDNGLRIMLLDNVDSLKKLKLPGSAPQISSVEYFYSVTEISENIITDEIQSECKISNISIYKFNNQVCPFTKIDEKPAANPYFYFFNQKFNHCWGLTIAIDEKGFVKPCLWSNKIVGNINDDKFENIYNDLTCYWEITKDKIDICKSCEFRYSCSDCRVWAEEKNGKLMSKTAFCTYNPFCNDE